MSPSKKSSKTPVARHYNFAMQKYILLEEQHQEVSAHLDQIRPYTSSSQTSSSTTLSSPSISPSPSPALSVSSASSRSSSSSSHGRSHTRSSNTGRQHHHQRPQARFSGWTNLHSGEGDMLDTIPDEETLQEISTGEQMLYDVNESMKRALTELLNCDAVRSDGGMRMWVQTRLMETEKELRCGRRRKSSPDY